MSTKATSTVFDRVPFKGQDVTVRLSRARNAGCLVLACATLILLASPAVSQAATCSTPEGNCYSNGLGFNGSYNPLTYGGAVQLCTHQLSLPSNELSTDFVDNEMTVYMDTSTEYWTEAGVNLGIHYNGQYNTTPVWFWADQNSKYGYNEHYATYGPSFDTKYTDEVYWNSGNWWQVNVGGFLGSSWQSTKYASGQYYAWWTGLEFTNTNAVESGSSSNLGWWNTNDAWQGGWPDPGQDVSSPASGYWVTTGQYWRDKTGSGASYAC